MASASVVRGTHRGEEVHETPSVSASVPRRAAPRRAQLWRRIPERDAASLLAMPADRFDDLPLDPEGAARALLLSLMARLLAPRGLAALADGSGGLRVVASRGLDLQEGALLADGGPGTLRPHGIALALPLRHASETVGLVALGDKATGGRFSVSEIAVARSLASAAAASVRAARAAADLKAANRELAARAQTLGTLVEMAQAFGSTLDRAAVVRRLGLTLMGQLLVSRSAVALRQPDGSLAVAGHWGPPREAIHVPEALADWNAPAPYREDGWAWAVPLRAGEVSRGVILLGPRATGADLDPTAADFAASLAALAVGALETADRVTERVERERLEGEVRLARRVQEALLPTGLPTVPGLDLAARWRPTQGVSGDAYDVAALPGGRLLVAVADVVGKGIPAALLMASLQAAVHTLRDDIADGFGLARATARINTLLCEGTEVDQFVTFAWALVDPEAGVVRSVTAGHPAPRLVYADGRIARLDVGGPLFGVLPEAEYAQVETPFAPGDLLVLFSDGVSEAYRGTEEFGDTALDATLADLAREPAETVVDRLGAAVLDFATDGVDDDLTLVTVRRTPA
ncbi:MAG: PP2C family protein-serine/threonine phosphatase [Bacteroidota bacterium]